MEKSNRSDQFLRFRQEFPVFIYEAYHIDYSEHGLDIRFDFSLPGFREFHPTLFLPRKDFFLSPDAILQLISPLVFHIGLVELISYWKAACPPRVIIRPHRLDATQIAWWKELWFQGLGEFFYLNGIHTTQEDFLTVEADTGPATTPLDCHLSADVLVPVGGGKDSVVTMEALRRQYHLTPMIVNPRGASVHSIFTAGFAHSGMIGIHRTIDPRLLELNELGFLNGHTPFSALLAFVSALAAVISNKRYIALSNESSANEETVPGSGVNHQYSKSIAFERDFREYSHRYLCPGLEYFSFLRPLNEIQIAGLFSRYAAYFPVFKSCNAGSKTDSWCGSCAKCLFTAVLLSPFLSPEQIRQIFHLDILEDLSLKPLLEQLAGLTPEKPFECVGTVAEVNACLRETISRYGDQPLPALLAWYRDAAHPSVETPPFQSFLCAWDPVNFLPPAFEKTLKGLIYG